MKTRILIAALLVSCAGSKAAIKSAAIDLGASECVQGAEALGAPDAGPVADVISVSCRTAAGEVVNLILPRKAAMLMMRKEAIK